MILVELVANSVLFVSGHGPGSAPQRPALLFGGISTMETPFRAGENKKPANHSKYSTRVDIVRRISLIVNLAPWVG